MKVLLAFATGFLLVAFVYSHGLADGGTMIKASNGSKVIVVNP